MPSRAGKIALLPVEADVQASQVVPVRQHRRGPNPSPSKIKRDADRVERHQWSTTGASGGPASDETIEASEVYFEGTQIQQSQLQLASIVEERDSLSRVLGADVSEEDREMTSRKQAERAQHNGNGTDNLTTIAGSTQTRHAPGNAIKADVMSVEVGGKHLLEDATLLVSGDVKRYGLVGPNGCGKTTLLRLISGNCDSDLRIPLPKHWGKPYLLDQLDPEPTGRSPLEEVLSSHTERSALLAEQLELTKQLEGLAGKDLDSDEMESMNAIVARMEELDGQLSYFDADEQAVTSILVGLGFHDGEGSVDGAPSLRARDDLITKTSAKVNDVVEVQDHDEEDWLRGMVTSIKPLMVCPIGWRDSYAWKKVRHVNELSGGWRKKVQLAKALYDQPRLLLLDEPTNHLDFHALLYLEEQLLRYGQREDGRQQDATVLIVSHNACFLKEVCDQALQIADLKIQTKPMAELSLEGLAAIQNGQKPTSGKWRFAFPTCDRANPEMHALSFHHVGFRSSPVSLPVFEDLHRLRFHGKSRSVLVGRNGSGKSTLLKLCLGMIKPTGGEVHADTCEVMHFSQHFNEQLDRHPALSAVSYLVLYCVEGLKKRCAGCDEDRMREHAGIVLKRFGLARHQAWNMSVADLSGGQKARVNFAFLSLCPAHLLILDEPTNHLDANGLEHLAEALEVFDGGVVLISHDELLIRRVLACSEHSELLICSDGQIQRQSGLQGFDTYRRAAFREQYLRAQAAELATAQRLQKDREKRRLRPCRRPSQSIASTREPTPEGQMSELKTEPLRNDALAALFRNKSKKKPRPTSQYLQK